MVFGGLRSNCYLDAKNTNFLPKMHGSRIFLILRLSLILSAQKTSSFRLNRRFVLTAGKKLSDEIKKAPRS